MPFALVALTQQGRFGLQRKKRRRLFCAQCLFDAGHGQCAERRVHLVGGIRQIVIEPPGQQREKGTDEIVHHHLARYREPGRTGNLLVEMFLHQIGNILEEIFLNDLAAALANHGFVKLVMLPGVPKERQTGRDIRRRRFT